MDTRTRLHEVIDLLYDAATDMDKWMPFLEAVARLMNAGDVQIAHGEISEPRLAFSINYGYDHLPPQEVERLLTHYTDELLPKDDPRVAAFQRRGDFPRTPFRLYDFIDETEFKNSRTYRELLVPLRVEHVIQFAVAHGDGTVSALNVGRRPGKQPFTEADCDRVGEIAPHFRRVIKLYKQFAHLDFDQRTALEALDHIPTGLVLADGDGRIRHLNRAAREIAADDDGLVCRDDVLSADRPEERDRLLSTVRHATDSARQGDILPGEAMTLSRAGGRPALDVLVSTLWGNHLRFGLGRLDDPAAVLFVTDPERPPETPAELLRHLFGLTPTEAALAEALVAQQSLDQAAAAAGLARNTARWHLNSIFDKTDTHSQTQLVKRVLSTPAWMNARRKYPELFP